MPGGEKENSSHSMELSQWREQWAAQVSTPEDMVRFVDDVRCCTAKELPAYPDFPSQSAVLREGAADVWFWKDDLHVETRLYYTRVFGGEPGFISYSLLPALVATNGRVADELIFSGLLSAEARLIYQIIEESGPIPIRDLKKLLGPDTKRAATRLLHELERQFIITKSGITGRTRGTYGYVWDLTERWMPEVLEAADRIGRSAAENMIRQRLAAFGVPPDSPFYRKVLGWSAG